MRTIRFGAPGWRRWLGGLPRAAQRRPRVEREVAAIIRAVRRDGDAALRRLRARFDGVRVGTLRVPPREVRSLALRADGRVVSALSQMARRIETYHRRQLDRGFRMHLSDGSVLEEVAQPLDSVGLYVPGGAGAYPSSLLMNAIPARVAGVPRIVVTTPNLSPAVAAALVLVGLEDSVYRVGGAQAVAALAYGTRAVPAVDKIVGPGNVYVAAAKRQVRGKVEIDHEAGPSEVVVLADETADASWVAADLLAQAEHGSGEEAVVLVTTSETLGKEAWRRVTAGLASVANRRTAARALRANGAVVLVRSLDQAVAAVNALAPEHAEVMTRDAARVAGRIVAGAVFVGPWTPVAVGDYGIGPNHVLPTGGAARYASPLGVRDFQRRQSRVRLTRAGLLRVARSMVAVAEAEGFPGHARSLLARLG